MSHFVKCLPRLLSPCIFSLPPPLASQVGGTKAREEEARKGTEDAQAVKCEDSPTSDLPPLLSLRVLSVKRNTDLSGPGRTSG